MRYGSKTVTDESAEMWEEAVAANYKMPFLTLTGGTEENNGDHQSA
jgi:hypothetical protein